MADDQRRHDLRAGLPSRTAGGFLAVQVLPQAAKELLVTAVGVLDRVIKLTGRQLARIGQRPPELGLEDAYLIVVG
jgi:hypothetical protein